jgi:pimeloyl-ACP methyl ester carboxylesterase
MQRRSLLAAPAIVTAAAIPAAAQAQPRILTEEFMVPVPGGEGEMFVRSKRPEGAVASPGRTVLFCHGATYPGAHRLRPAARRRVLDGLHRGRGFDVWCMDLPGYGRSTRPAAMSQPAEANPPLVRSDAAVAAVGAVQAFIRERRGIPRTALMAWSWGCSLVARHATDNPATVERLVLYAPQWLREGASPAATGAAASLGAYRTVTQAQARERWTAGVPEAARANLIPPGWFEHWAGVTWATDPEGLRQNPAVLRRRTACCSTAANTGRRAGPTGTRPRSPCRR